MKKLIITLVGLAFLAPFAYAQQYVMLKTDTYVAATTSGSGGTVRTIGTSMTFVRLSWNVTGGTLAACTVKIQTSTDSISWVDLVGSSSTCTSNGTTTFIGTTPNYIRSFLVTKSATAALTTTLVGWMALPVAVITSGGAPVGACSNGTLYQDTVTNNLYLCESGVWVLISFGGGGAISGTGVNTQVAVWSGATTVSSDANLTFNGTTLSTPAANVTGTLTTATANVTGLSASKAIRTDASKNLISSDDAGLGTTGCLTLTIANQSPTGTTNNKLVKVVNDPPVAQITGLSDFNLAVGIVQSGGGASGEATVCFVGTANCVFDNAATAGHYFVGSTTVAGDCHDAGATQPTDVVYYGTVKETGAAGTRAVFLNTPDTLSGIKNNVNNGRTSKQSATDQVEVSDSTSQTTWRTLCSGGPIVFNATSNTFSCLAGPDPSILGGIIGGVAGTAAGPFGSSSTANKLMFHSPAGFWLYGPGICGTAGAVSNVMEEGFSANNLSATDVFQRGVVTTYSGNSAASCTSNTMVPFPMSDGTIVEVNHATLGADVATYWSGAIVGLATQPLGVAINTSVAATTTAFQAPGQGMTLATTTTDEQLVQLPVPALTVTKLCALTTTTQGAGGSLVFTLRKNGVDQAIVVTIEANQTAGEECATGSIAYAGGDKLSWSMLNNHSANSATINYVMVYTSPAGGATGILIFPKANRALTASTIRYSSMFVNNTLASGETSAWATPIRAGTIQNFYCYQKTAPTTATTVISLYHNGVISPITVNGTVASGNDATLSDVTHTITMAANDSVSLEWSPGAAVVGVYSGCTAAFF